MNKKIATTFFLVSILLLNSCVYGGGRMFGNEDRLADKRMKQLIQALENQDGDALKAMFSKRALDEAENFEDGLEYLLKLFKGKVESYERDGALSVHEFIEYGKKTKEVISAYDVVINKQGYVFLLIDYTVNTIDPNNVGLYTLRITTSEEDLSWQERKIPGIYKPLK